MIKFKVFIPIIPPGINQTYKIGHRRMYKSKEANDWAKQAGLIIGAAAGEQNWIDDSKFYEIVIEFNGMNFDVDAPVKLILDTVSQKLGFNDKKFMKMCIEKIPSKKDGVYVQINDYFRKAI